MTIMDAEGRVVRTVPVAAAALPVTYYDHVQRKGFRPGISRRRCGWCTGIGHAKTRCPLRGTA